ncbi:hypothetical protein ACFFGV_17560 [Pontibacillus salicampi]|uniref:Yip1 domain-containing protein n=1 Tax=Pontibacillus salicampi TaxID=1449801 RepID=A0ABV6LSS5_9BACI
MSYKVQVAKLFFRREDSMFQINKAEAITHLWKRISLFLLLSMLVYGFTAWKGLGMTPFSAQATSWSFATYETMKLFFLSGRVLYGLFFALIILFYTPFFYWLFTGISYKKLMTVQLNVLFVLLLERLTWVAFVQYLGLEWYVSPFSFGVIASYLTDMEWLIYFGGAASLFQIWVMWLQSKALFLFSSIKKWKLVVMVVLLHLFYWAAAASLTYYDVELLSFL